MINDSKEKWDRNRCEVKEKYVWIRCIIGEILRYKESIEVWDIVVNKGGNNLEQIYEVLKNK